MSSKIITIENACVKLKLMSLGINPGQYIKVLSKNNGLNKIQILNSDMEVLSTLALRTEEMKEIFFSNSCELG